MITTIIITRIIINLIMIMNNNVELVCQVAQPRPPNGRSGVVIIIDFKSTRIHDVPGIGVETDA